MTPADADSYRKQFAAAQRRLPRGHVIHHCTWRDGQLSTLSRPAERPEPNQAVPDGRVRRGAMQGTLL